MFDKVWAGTVSPQNFADYLTVTDAAALLGVSTSTLRNWDRTGKLKAMRHPMNGYRLYDPKRLHALLDQIGGNGVA